MQPYRNPYESVPDELLSRINSDVPSEEYKMLQRILTERGTIQTTVNLLWKKLIDELTRLGITDFTRADDFKRVVAESHLVFDEKASPPNGGGGTPLRPDTKTNGPDVARGNARTRASHPTAPHEPSNLPRGGGRKGRRGVDL